MRRTILLTLWIFASLAVGFSQTSDAPAAYAGADIVFTGHVEKMEPSPSGLQAKFNVDQPIKGLTPAQTTLCADLPTVSRCHNLEKNHSYLVYGQLIAGKIWIDPCDGSKLISRAEDDLKYIHSINPKVSQKCNGKKIEQLAKKSPVVVEAEVVGIGETMNPLLLRPWCGLSRTTENAYYHVLNVLKGQVPDTDIAVEHMICWDTITVDGYIPELSPELFKQGNTLLLFLGPAPSDEHPQVITPYKAIYADLDDNCGAISAHDESAQAIIDSIRANPEKYVEGPDEFRQKVGEQYSKWLDETVDVISNAPSDSYCATN